ncbi:MAG: sigma-70 family RNA polymerase sigma factor [Thermoanaerobaculia bacterium]
MSDREPAAADVTGLLQAWRSGDAVAGDRLLERIYHELKRIAASQLRRERPDHTLQTTALVHEAFLRLIDQRGVDWRDRTHFFGLAAGMMRRVLVDHYRARQARKRTAPTDPPTAPAFASTRAAEVLDLDRALTALAESHPRQARVVEMRYFADLDVEEVALCLDISTPTVKRDWRFARAWLNAALRDPRAAP